jgi:hypothetical protein
MYIKNKLELYSFIRCSKKFIFWIIRFSEISVHPLPQNYTGYSKVHCKQLCLLEIVYGQETRILTTDKQVKKENKWI